jgi:hypothetical protein
MWHICGKGAHRVFVGKHRKRYQSDEKGVDERILLKWIFKK